jgi:hypothetical protein
VSFEAKRDHVQEQEIDKLKPEIDTFNHTQSEREIYEDSELCPIKDVTKVDELNYVQIGRAHV